ncbi:MAG TPA: hypothetical protein VH643_27405 [Gemmataceae bacterium]
MNAHTLPPKQLQQFDTGTIDKAEAGKIEAGSEPSSALTQRRRTSSTQA